MKRQGGVSHLPMATGAVCSPNGVRAISTPFTPVPKGPPAGRGGGDTRGWAPPPRSDTQELLWHANFSRHQF